MRVKDLNLPIKYRKTFDILDSTKIKTFMDCHRKFFLEYILGWQPEKRSIHLVFGIAYHLGMEYIKLNGYTEENAIKAGDIFEESFREHFSALTDMDNAPKNVANARLAFQEYVKTYANTDKTTKTLYTEVGGYIPIAEDRNIYVKIDYIGLDEKGRIFGQDYKTGSRFSTMWMNQWLMNIQMLTYNHALKTVFSDRNVFGMIVDGIILYKRQQKDLQTMNRFVRVPVRLLDDMMTAYLFDINYIFDLIEWNWNQLEISSDKDPVLQAFAKNTQSCTKYGMCPFFNVCTIEPNPLQLKEPPMFFTERFWDPTVETPIKTDVADIMPKE